MTGLDDELVRSAYYCADRELRARRRARLPIPASLHRLHQHLGLAIRCASQLGQETATAAAGLELISAQQAAQLLGLSKRQAQRLAADLDGEIVGGRWLFRRSVVEQYANERMEHQRGNN